MTTEALHVDARNEPWYFKWECCLTQQAFWFVFDRALAPKPNSTLHFFRLKHACFGRVSEMKTIVFPMWVTKGIFLKTYQQSSNSMFEHFLNRIKSTREHIIFYCTKHEMARNVCRKSGQTICREL